MNSVYLCDDEPEWLKRISKYISNYQVQHDWLLQVTYVTVSPYDLLSFLKVNTPYSGIYFLDIDFKTSLNGLELGSKIRELDPAAMLVFVTTHEELVMETFRYRLMALDYIVKDQNNIEQQVNNVLKCLEKRYLTNQTSIQNKLCVKTCDGYYFLSKDEIYYIESQNGKHKISIHTADKILTISRPLTELSKELGNGFLLCRKGCLVNLKHIKSARRLTLTLLLDNEECIDCSTRIWSTLMKQLSM